MPGKKAIERGFVAVGSSSFFTSIKMAVLSIAGRHYVYNFNCNLPQQIKWNRFVNIHGGLGCNIPCDMYNEHINKLFKEVISNMGANLTDVAMQRTARAVTILHHIRANFDNASGVPMSKRAHSTQPDDEDVLRVATVIKTDRILGVIPGRSHSSHAIPANPLAKLNKHSLVTWIHTKIIHASKYQIPQGEGNLSHSDASYGEDHSYYYEQTNTSQKYYNYLF